ncbi:Chromatin structure-remodeling complex subunit like [Quillaja saponaria]|uniref:Chromatin structure-remodeling complex subunit like n=1 Tax=Quillaja saponaria TaxID=32244 RepID=A0AAD7QFU3_QUISA|nr:Chromatin structure-remodeling complex subunit like [Quillaja saponaria]
MQKKALLINQVLSRDGKIINMCQYNCEANNVGTSRADENIAHCPNTTREVPPSFEFYVWSDEGIGLSVDLNSSPSDWSNKFKNEVCVSENDYGNNSRSLRQDLRCLGESDKQSKSSFCWNMNAGCVDDYNGETQPSPSSRLVNHDLTVFDQQEKGDTSLMSASVMPCSTTVNVAQNPKEDQSIISAEASYDAPNHSISMDESCARYASREILDSDVISTLLTKSACGYAGNSGSDTGTLEKQTSELKGEVCGNLTLMNSCKFVNPNMVYCGGSASGSVEYQVSEAASCHKDFLVSVCENDIFLGPTDLKHTSETEQSGLVNPSDRNLDSDGNHFLSFGEEWEVDKFINGRESSECSQFDNSVKKTCPSSDGLECRKVHHKNRELTEH